MADIVRWPFPLPEHFLDELGYGRTVEAFESPAMRARLADLLRQQGVDTLPTVVPGQRRFVALWWEPAGDELAWSDGAHGGAGQLNHWAWLDYLHDHGQFDGPISAWLARHQVDFGCSDAEARHALVVDSQSASAWVAPLTLARRVVHDQSPGQELHQ